MGASLARAARLAGRVSGDSTVAYAYAFTGAAEAAIGLVVPDRAVWLRALLAELEGNREVYVSTADETNQSNLSRTTAV